MIGKCALCGKETEMTFEHIPPRSCFNSFPVKPVSGEKLIRSMAAGQCKPCDTSGLEYINMQSGMGKRSLCSACNSITGKWYGQDYAKFIRCINNLLIENKPDADGNISFSILDMYPLRIIKQMLSMICSINQQIREDERIARLAEFVLDKHRVGLDSKEYRIFIYIAKKHHAKYCPLTVISRKVDSPERSNINVVSEIFVYPIGILVYFSPDESFSHFGADITSFCDVDYDQKCDAQFLVPVLETYNIFPLDYRNKEDIKQATGDAVKEPPNI